MTAEGKAQELAVPSGTSCVQVDQALDAHGQLGLTSSHITIMVFLAVFYKTIFKRFSCWLGTNSCSNHAHANLAPSFPLPVWCAMFQLYVLTFLQLDVSGTDLLTVYRAKMCSFGLFSKDGADRLFLD